MTDLVVACVFTHDKTRANYHGVDCTYTREYPDKLRSMVARHLTVPHRFVCLAEKVERDYDVQLTEVWPHWWCKISLFDHFRGPTLYFDLDTVIVGNIDWMVVPKRRFAAWWYDLKPSGYDHWCSAFMAWSGDFSYITKQFRQRSQELMQVYRGHPRKGDQAYITEHAGEVEDIEPKDRREIVQFPCRDIGNASLVYCSGGKKPHLYRDHPIVQEHWH